MIMSWALWKKFATGAACSATDSQLYVVLKTCIFIKLTHGMLVGMRMLWLGGIGAGASDWQ